MSCNYAEGLSPYDHKGVLGVAEKFDPPEAIEEKCKQLAEWILKSQHVVMHTGAGISTAAGIPDFRGPNGVWTLEKKGLKPNINVSFNDAIPTKTHMALKKLVECGFVKYIVTQNIDGLHLRTGLSREFISELHGNMFVEQCNYCNRQFIRTSATTTVGQKTSGNSCMAAKVTGRGCRGKLHDTILDWEANLPEDDLNMADYHSNLADLSICIGTTLQIVPSGKLPLHVKKNGGRLAIINLQPTKHDKKADLLINTYADEMITKLMKHLGLEIPEYSEDMDPTRNRESSDIVYQWTFRTEDVKVVKNKYNLHIKNAKRIKSELKNGRKKFKAEINVDRRIKKEETNKEEVKKEVQIKEEFPVQNSEERNEIKDEENGKVDEIPQNSNDQPNGFKNDEAGKLEKVSQNNDGQKELENDENNLKDEAEKLEGKEDPTEENNKIEESS